MDAEFKQLAESLALKEREITIFYQRAFEHLTYDAIAKTFGVTRERIRQIYAKTRRKIKHPSRKVLFDWLSTRVDASIW